MSDAIDRQAAKPEKLISAERAVAVAMEALVNTYIARQWKDADDYRFKATIAMAAAIDSLPAAREERWEKAIEWMSEQRYAAVEKQDFDTAMAFRNAMDYLKTNRLSPPAEPNDERPVKPLTTEGSENGQN